MSYPNITAAQIRSGIPHITVTLCTDARVLELLTDAITWLHGKMSGKIDLVALKARSTTPVTWQMILIARARALVLSEKYGSARVANSGDIDAQNNLAIGIINELISGETRLLDENEVEIPTGMNYDGISSNKDGADDLHKPPYFGMGEDGQGVTDINSGKVYNSPD